MYAYVCRALEVLLHCSVTVRCSIFLAVSSITAFTFFSGLGVLGYSRLPKIILPTRTLVDPTSIWETKSITNQTICSQCGVRYVLECVDMCVFGIHGCVFEVLKNIYFGLLCLYFRQNRTRVTDAAVQCPVQPFEPQLHSVWGFWVLF